MKRSILIWLSLLFLTATSSGSEPLSLKDALRISIQNNLHIKAKDLLYEASKLGKEASDKVYLPRLNLLENYQRTDNPPMAFTHKLSQRSFEAKDFELYRLNHPDPISNWHTELRLEQPVFNQGREIITKEAGRLAEGLSQLELRYTKEVIAFEVMNTFFQLLLVREELGCLNSTLKEAEEAERIAKERYNVGSTLYSDVLNANSFLSQIKTQIYNTSLKEKDFFKRLNLLMGDSKEWILQDDQTIPDPEQGPTSFKEDSLVKEALDKRVDLMLKEMELKDLRLKEKASLYAFYPSLNLYGKYAWDSQDLSLSSNSYEVGFVLQLNLFNGLSDRSRYKASKKAVESGEQALAYLRENVGVEIKEAINAVDGMIRQYHSSLDEVKRAEEALRILKVRYKEGMALFMEVLAMENALKEALLSKARALYGYKLAIARLHFLSGKILEVCGGD